MHSPSLSDCPSTSQFEHFLEFEHFCQETSSDTIFRKTPKNLIFLVVRQQFFKMLQDPLGILACFSAVAGEGYAGGVTKSGQNLFMSVYKTKFAENCCWITVTWFKHLMLHGLSVSIESPEPKESPEAEHTCKIEIKPWCFWRKQGFKWFTIGGQALAVFWDLKGAKFNGETEPGSEYYVAVVCDQEVVLLLGDLKKDAYRKTGCRPALIDPILVSRKEHVFGKKKFSTRLKFHEKGQFHEISIERKNKCVDPAMEIRIDGHLVTHVKHLQWKFRGNESINFSKLKVEVSWDVHDWLFSPGLRHALFIFKLTVPATSPASSTLSSPLSSPEGSWGSFDGFDPSLHEFCLFLYAWKVE